MVAKWTASELARSVVEVVRGVVVHQWPRWGPLMGHMRQMEGWWKAEFLTAIEAWCWSLDAPQDFWPRPEVKPREFGRGESQQAPDIVVAPIGKSGEDFNYAAGPRVWLEIKERGTWWGSAVKAFGAANNGLRHDLTKWDPDIWSSDDVVLACQITSHEGTWGREQDPFPKGWVEKLEEIAKEYPRYEPARIVGYPCWASPKEEDKEKEAVRWVRLDIFSIHPRSIGPEE